MSLSWSKLLTTFPSPSISSQILLLLCLDEEKLWKNFAFASPCSIQRALLFSFQVRTSCVDISSFLFLMEEILCSSNSGKTHEGNKEKSCWISWSMSISSYLWDCFFFFPHILTSDLSLFNFKTIPCISSPPEGAISNDQKEWTTWEKPSTCNQALLNLEG